MDNNRPISVDLPSAYRHRLWLMAQERKSSMREIARHMLEDAIDRIGADPDCDMCQGTGTVRFTDSPDDIVGYYNACPKCHPELQ